MMTDKATVEMESPVAGKVTKLAGEVGDQIAIGSVLVVIETEGERCRGRAGRSSEGGAAAGRWRRGRRPRRRKKRFRSWRPRESEAAPAPQPEGRSRSPSPTAPPTGQRHGAKVLASPAVRQRARDLGIDLAQVKTVERPHPPRRPRRLPALQRRQRVSRGAGAARRRDDQGRRPPPQDRREHAGGEAPHPAFHPGRGIRRHRRSRTRGR